MTILTLIAVALAPSLVVFGLATILSFVRLALERRPDRDGAGATSQARPDRSRATSRV